MVADVPLKIAGIDPGPLKADIFETLYAIACERIGLDVARLGDPVVPSLGGHPSSQFGIGLVPIGNLTVAVLFFESYETGEPVIVV